MSWASAIIVRGVCRSWGNSEKSDFVLNPPSVRGFGIFIGTCTNYDRSLARTERRSPRSTVPISFSEDQIDLIQKRKSVIFGYFGHLWLTSADILTTDQTNPGQISPRRCFVIATKTEHHILLERDGMLHALYLCDLR